PAAPAPVPNLFAPDLRVFARRQYLLAARPSFSNRASPLPNPPVPAPAQCLRRAAHLSVFANSLALPPIVPVPVPPSLHQDVQPCCNSTMRFDNPASPVAMLTPAGSPH